MNYQDVLNQIEEYQLFEPIDEAYASLFSHFISERKDDAFNRSCAMGHITASAVVVNERFDAMLLMHHKKLDIWLQFGGHTDGSADVLEAAHRELREESGITDMKLFSESIFDLSLHEIPERKDEAEHLHFDIRYLFVVDSQISFKVNEHEGYDIRWFDLDAVGDLERCWLDRVVRKVKAVHDKKYLV